MPEIEDVRPSCDRRCDPVDVALQRGSAREQEQRVEVALQRPVGSDGLRARRNIGSRVETNAIYGRDGGQPGGLARADPAREGDDLGGGMARPNGLRNSHDGREAPFLQFRLGQYARPGIEDLHDIDTGPNLRGKMFDGGFDKNVDQFLERFRVPIGEEAGGA